MSKSRDRKMSFMASLAVVLFAGTCLGACVGAPEPGVDEGTDEISSEPVAEAAEAVGVGGTCNPLAGAYCDPGLHCCVNPPYFIGACRSFDTDPYNCGSCGHICDYNPTLHARVCINATCF